MKDQNKEVCRNEFPVAMAYVPWQKSNATYECLERAFEAGTLYPELNLPFTGRRCVN